MLQRLVGCETGAERRDLEEDAARLAEVDRLEVEAVDHRRRARARTLDRGAPRLVLLLRRRPCDVMDRAGALPSQPLGIVVDVEAAAVIAPRDEARLEAERSFEEAAALLRVAGVRTHAGEAAQRMLFRD